MESCPRYPTFRSAPFVSIGKAAEDREACFAYGLYIRALKDTIFKDIEREVISTQFTEQEREENRESMLKKIDTAFEILGLAKKRRCVAANDTLNEDVAKSLQLILGELSKPLGQIGLRDLDLFLSYDINSYGAEKIRRTDGVDVRFT